MATIDRIMPPYPDTCPTEIWKGVADVNVQGVAIAIDMLKELECNKEIGSGVCGRDLCELEDWPRLGTQFRNIVAEYLQRARDSGPDVEAGFCAVLTDMIAPVLNCIQRRGGGGGGQTQTITTTRDSESMLPNRGRCP